MNPVIGVQNVTVRSNKKKMGDWTPVSRIAGKYHTLDRQGH